MTNKDTTGIKRQTREPISGFIQSVALTTTVEPKMCGVQLMINRNSGLLDTTTQLWLTANILKWLLIFYTFVFHKESLHSKKIWCVLGFVRQSVPYAGFQRAHFKQSTFIQRVKSAHISTIKMRNKTFLSRHSSRDGPLNFSAEREKNFWYPHRFAFHFGVLAGMSSVEKALGFKWETLRRWMSTLWTGKFDGMTVKNFLSRSSDLF